MVQPGADADAVGPVDPRRGLLSRPQIRLYPEDGQFGVDGQERAEADPRIAAHQLDRPVPAHSVEV
ncbi:hypothetical protein [Streptomyces sp. SID2999]|uniref:hypothetical protein n=1 Tax=Streptomyces sp. SID2999 TaxID=2690258 RepID=UPI0031BB7C7D